MNIKILSINTNGLNHPAKRASLWRTATKLSCQIICAQETHFQADRTPTHTHRDFPTVFTASCDKKRKGVLIAVHKSLDFQVFNKVADPNGRFLIMVCSIEGFTMTLASIYAPNIHQTRFFNRTLKKIRSVQKGPLLLCGDFNIPPDRNMDTSVLRRRNQPSLQHLLHRNDLFDVWRCHHPSDREYTHHSVVHNSYSRIDLFLSDKFLLQRAADTEITPITWSDHAPICMTLSLSKTVPSQKPWRVRADILKSPKNVESLRDSLTEFFQNNLGSVSESATLWCAHKAFSRGLLIQLTHRANRRRTQHLDTLTVEIKKLETQNQNNPSRDLKQKLMILRQELRSHLLDTYDRNLKKLRAKHFVTNNKAGKMLAGKIKGQRAKNRIKSIQHPSTGETLHDPRDIANAFGTYYESLYNL